MVSEIICVIKNLRDFMHKSVHHCITTFLILHTENNVTTFLDLKTASDIADRHNLA